MCRKFCRLKAYKKNGKNRKNKGSIIDWLKKSSSWRKSIGNSSKKKSRNSESNSGKRESGTNQNSTRKKKWSAHCACSWTIPTTRSTSWRKATISCKKSSRTSNFRTCPYWKSSKPPNFSIPPIPNSTPPFSSTLATLLTRVGLSHLLLTKSSLKTPIISVTCRTPLRSP